METKPEEQQEYYKKIQALLDHYVDGWEVFINANKAKDYDYPLIRKEEHINDPYIPKTWLELVAEVQGIIAKDKMGLDFYTPRIEIIRADHMLDVYTTVGLPHSYRHWSFGRQRMVEEKKYDQNKHLAYEIVINSDPCIAYCMDTNTPVLQMLVIAHACYGHNAVFKSNYLFQEFTNADTILSHIKSMSEFIEECEEKYGVAEVEDFLDFCHAMQLMDVPETKKKKVLSKSELKARAEKKARDSFENSTTSSSFNRKASNDDMEEEEGRSRSTFPYCGDKNILGYMAEHDERFPDWKRTIMRMRSELAQYFKPQRMTQLLNEGYATYTHMKILDTMYSMGLIDYGMHAEYNNVNDGVVYQPSAIRKVQDEDGNIVEQFVGAKMNVYALGLAIYRDIERICTNPTDEDREYFKHFAGSGDPQAMINHAMESCSDQTFIEQYLSPTVMRKFAMFEIEDREENDYYEVLAIHNGDGFKALRHQLAEDYRFSGKIPDVSVFDYQELDRCLILRHMAHNDVPVDADAVNQILEHIHSQRGYPVVLESVDEDGYVLETYSSPPSYDYKMFRLPDHGKQYYIR